MSGFDPEGPVGQQLKASLVVELSNKFNIADDAEDVSEFILVLIGSNKTASEISSEVRELVDIPIDEAFVNTIFAEIQRLMTQGQGVQQQPASEQTQAPSQQPIEQQQVPQQVTQQVPQPAQQQIQQPTQQLVQQSLEVDHLEHSMEDAQVHPQQHDMPMNLPTGPKGLQNRNQHTNNKFNNRGGINKNTNNRNGPKKSFAMQNPGNFEKVLAMSNSNVTNLKQFIQKPAKGRCRDFPYCNNKECQFSHPTKLCFAFPNCSNPPGTCNYLHPGEDDELMAKLAKSKQEYMEKKKNTESAGTIGICKFGMLCSKDICPFGHPTPANKEAKVLVLQWCPDGKTCQDVNCTKAHPSPNYQAPQVEMKPKPKPAQPELTLEQCKFGPSCTNLKCPRRHATTPVVCREGANCVRIDCFFSHPIDEDCRFGINCTNKTCMFRHPEGRNLPNPSNTWSKDPENATNERSFAVPEDQVMEQATQES